MKHPVYNRKQILHWVAWSWQSFYLFVASIDAHACLLIVSFWWVYTKYLTLNWKNEKVFVIASDAALNSNHNKCSQFALDLFQFVNLSWEHVCVPSMERQTLPRTFDELHLRACFSQQLNHDCGKSIVSTNFTNCSGCNKFNVVLRSGHFKNYVSAWHV